MSKSIDNIKNYAIMNLQDILRAQDIERWTIVNVVRKQSLAEHTFNVIAIARSLARYVGIRDENIMKYAFDHDLDEILTGDIPTPAKEMLKTKDAYIGKSRSRCDSIELAIVSLADSIEAIWYINIHGLGRHSVQVCDYLIDKLNKRVALYSSMSSKLEEAVGKVVRDINEGEFTL